MGEDLTNVAEGGEPDDNRPWQSWRSPDGSLSIEGNGSASITTEGGADVRLRSDSSLTLETETGARIDVDGTGGEPRIFDADGEQLPPGTLPDGVDHGTIAGDGSFQIVLDDGSYHVRDAEGSYGFTDTGGNATQINPDTSFSRNYADGSGVFRTEGGAFGTREEGEAPDFDNSLNLGPELDSIGALPQNTLHRL